MTPDEILTEKRLRELLARTQKGGIHLGIVQLVHAAHTLQMSIDELATAWRGDPYCAWTTYSHSAELIKKDG